MLKLASKVNRLTDADYRMLDLSGQPWQTGGLRGASPLVSRNAATLEGPKIEKISISLACGVFA